MPVRKFLTLAQAVEAVLESDDDDDGDNDCDDGDSTPEICILPPSDGDESEVEHVDEEKLSPDEPSG